MTFRYKDENNSQLIRPSDDGNDFWVAQAPRAHALLDMPQFSAVIVATNGAMARMHTVEPLAFARFKQWMSGLPERDPLKACLFPTEIIDTAQARCRP